MKHFNNFFGKFFALSCVMLCLSLFNAFAQEQTVEQKELSQTEKRQLEAINAEANGSREQKEDAVASIKSDFIDKKKMTKEVQTILKNLATEGIRNKIRADGRVMNNFWQVRKDCIVLLGEFTFDAANTDLAKSSEDTLRRIALDDPYPDNVAACFSSLGKIAVTDPDADRVKIIAGDIDFIFTSYDSAASPPMGSMIGPTGDDLLATQYIWTMTKLATSGVLKGDTDTFRPFIQTIRNIAAGGGDTYNQKQKYSGKVRNEAKKALKIIQQ